MRLLHIYNISVHELYPPRIALAYDELLRTRSAADDFEMPELAFLSAKRGFASRTDWLAPDPRDASLFWVPIWAFGVCAAHGETGKGPGHQWELASPGGPP